MNLPDFSNDEALNQLRKEMGADLIPWVPEIGKLVSTGIEVPPDEITTRPNGTLEYKGRTVVVYIRDQRVSSNDPESLCKFHVADCSTLKTMRSAGRYERYVVATRTDGKFIVKFLDRGGYRVERELYVCKNCLSRLNYQNYRYRANSGRNEIRNNFDLEEFFEKYGNQITRVPTHTDITGPTNDYPPNWKQIADKYKEDQGWKCEACYLDLGNKKSFLHVHHKNGLKYDNDPENHLALCIVCHANQPQHQHLKSDPNYEECRRLQQLQRLGTHGWLVAADGRRGVRRT